MTEFGLIGYYGMYLLGTVLMFTVSLCTFKKYDLKRSQAFVFTLIALVGGLTGTVIMGNIYTATLRAVGILGNSNMAIYGALMFVPILIILVCLISSQPWRRILDMLAPAGLIFTACAKLGCLFLGCCPGIECSFGVYNYQHDAVMFPSAIFEAVTMFIIIFMCIRYGTKSKKYIPGTVYPIMVGSYAITRFFWEFLRYYPSDEARYVIFGVLSFWQFCSVITLALSIVWLVGIKQDWFQKAKAYIELKQFEKAEAERKVRAEKRKNKKKKRK